MTVWRKRAKWVLVLGLAIAACSIVAWGTRPSPVERAQQLIGRPLPSSARDVKVAERAGFFGGDYFIASSMNRNDYQALVRALQLHHRADLLKYWSGALDAHGGPEWWTVSRVNNADTHFGERHSTYLVARYESGRLFLKIHVY